MVGRLRSVAAGEAAFRAARSVVHAARRWRHPELGPYEQLTSVRCAGREVNFRHRRTYEDRQVLVQCFVEEQYRMPHGAHGALLQRTYEGIIGAGLKPLIVDCGANIGASVVWFALRFPHAHVVAIEPAPDNFALLRHNTAGLDVDLRHAGIAAQDGSARLSDPRGGAWAYRTETFGEDAAEGAAADASAVQMLGLADLLAAKSHESYVPFLLKIDIEGAEGGLFDGDTSGINRFPVILLEPHDWMLPGQRSSLGFFRFHAAAGREFAMKAENVASIAWDESLLQYKGKVTQ